MPIPSPTREIVIRDAHMTVADDPKMIPVEQWGCFEIPGPPKVIIWGKFEENTGEPINNPRDGDRVVEEPKNED